MLYRQRLGIVFFFLSMLLSSCQFLQKSDTTIEQASEQAAKRTSQTSEQAASSPPQQALISGYPTSGARELTVNPSNHQLSMLPKGETRVANMTAATAARTAVPFQAVSSPAAPAALAAAPVSTTPRLAAPSSVDSVRQQSIVESLDPIVPADTAVRVSTGSKQSAWLGGGVAGGGTTPIPDPLSGAASDHSPVLISSMRHPKTPGVNMPEEEKASTSRELAPRPNKAELRGLRAPKLKSTVPLPHE